MLLVLVTISQDCFVLQSSSGLDVVENTEQGIQSNQCQYTCQERQYSFFQNYNIVALEYSKSII